MIFLLAVSALSLLLYVPRSSGPSGGRALPGPARELRPLDPGLRQGAGWLAKNASHPDPLWRDHHASRVARPRKPRGQRTAS